MTSSRLLLVDDDAPARHDIARHLSRHGFQVDERDRLRSLDDDLDATAFDALVLDAVAAPDARGAGLARLRARSSMPVVVLQRSTDVADRIVALELGADAVLAKPVPVEELRVRLGRLMWRAASRGSARSSSSCSPSSASPVGRRRAEPVVFGGWRYEPDRRRLCTSSGLETTLSHAEGRLFLAFLQHPRHTLGRDRLLDLARGEGVAQLDRSVDLLVSRLRQKLAPDARAAAAIRTVRGIGYMFDALASDVSAGNTDDTSAMRGPANMD